MRGSDESTSIRYEEWRARIDRGEAVGDLRFNGRVAGEDIADIDKAFAGGVNVGGLPLFKQAGGGGDGEREFFREWHSAKIKALAELTSSIRDLASAIREADEGSDIYGQVVDKKKNGHSHEEPVNAEKSSDGPCREGG